MGDRNNPIKFGPEWLRNFSREGSSGNSNNPGGSGGAAGGGPPTASANTNNSSSSQLPKVQLAKLRYGREEMLALYDRSVEPPAELKYFDLLYNPRGKPPLALNYEEEIMRDNMRSGPPIGGLSSQLERFGMGRGTNPPDGRARGRLPFVRPMSVGRGYTKTGMSGAPGYTERGEEAAFDGTPLLNRSWSASNGTSTNIRNGLENPPEWNQNTNKVFRSRWQGTSTNWRRATSSREEGEEWRSSESNRPRSMQQQEKWDRDWSERGNRSKSGQSWGNNRPWAGDTPTSDDNLPEWAFDNMEACGGTFDAQGAFHGYSNDDSNLPKAQGDPLYPLTRSHTQGSFTRSKTMEEGSEEWWASEKAKKLSPKRFDANDIKFKKLPPTTEPNASSSSATTSTVDPNRFEPPEKLEKEPEPIKELGDKRFAKKNPFMFKQKLTESKTFDALMRSDINQEEASDERGNFKSVMINANNGLRQKHQNIVATAVDILNRQSSPSPVHTRNTPAERDRDQEKHTPAKKRVDEFVEFAFEDKELSPHEIKNIPLPPKTTSSHSSATAMGKAMASSNMMNTPPPSNPGLQHCLNSVSNQGLPKQGMPGPGTQPSTIPHQTQSSIGMPQSQPREPGNSSLGMPSPSLPLSSIPPPNISTTGMSNAGIQSPSRPSARTTLMAGSSIGSMLAANAAANGTTSSLFGIGQNQNTSQQLQSPGELHRQPPVSQPSQASMFPMHLQNQSPQNFRSSLYGNLLQQPPPPPAPLPDQWFYEDPKKNIQGPFSSKDMFNWYRAGFFTSSLMVRRACDTHMRPLGSYGPVVPFAMLRDILKGHMQRSRKSWLRHKIKVISKPKEKYMLDFERTVRTKNSIDIKTYSNPTVFLKKSKVLSPNDVEKFLKDAPDSQYLVTKDVLSSSFPMSSGYDPRPQGPRDSMMGSQQSLGIGDVMNMNSQEPTLDSLQFGSVGNNFIRNAASAAFGQQPMVDSLWSQPSSSSDMMWMQQGMTSRNEPRVNNLPMYFWDQQATPMSNKLLPEEIAKEMKTEDQILAQLRAQNMNAPFQPSVQPAALMDEGTRATPDLSELEKLVHQDALNVAAAATSAIVEAEAQVEIQIQAASEKNKSESAEDFNISTTSVKSSPVQKATENKQTKPKESDKTAKNKENNATKTKKKPKDDKKDEESDAKSKDEDFYKSEKKSEESSPSKSKKDDKQSKKELEKEKKEWIKEGFTIVKGPEKTNNKDSKKKVEEVKAAEEAERKRKEEEKVIAEEEKRRKQAEALKNKQDQAQPTRASIDSVSKKAPWSAVLSPSQQATDRDGLTLAEIQRLEREKKLEQIKQQQAMMQLLARQQMQQREQEMQASLGWAKNKVASTKNIPGKSMGEIQAEARRQQAAAVAAAAAATALEEELNAAHVMPPPPAPWSNAQNGGGFWDTERINQISQKTVDKPQEPPKPVEPKPKKKQPQPQPGPAPSNNKESSPAHEFEAWCSNVLNLWSSKIDVPTFIGFLKDIESPFEVKEYVKCYLGESKDSNDFSRQFLERRCKLLRAGTVTPSDDLCSPAAAINPRAAAASEYQEGKGKKSKKNKMLKVDARILGFSVTASEDRINVGDIDTV